MVLISIILRSWWRLKNRTIWFFNKKH